MLDRLTNRIRRTIEGFLPWYDAETSTREAAATKEAHRKAIEVRIDAEDAIRRARVSYQAGDRRLRR